MAKIAVFETLKRRARELRAATGGNVTTMFALAVIPMIGFVGAAVDYSRANSVKAAMQAAADSTALMLSKEAPGLTDAQIQQKANDYYKALLNRPEAAVPTIKAKFTTAGGNQIVIDANSSVKTNFMKLMGFTTLNVGVESQVKWGNMRLRVALVLDNTGSMADDGKMAALKTATANLLTQLKNAATKDGDVLVSIVPFVKDVNMGATNYSQNWIDWTDWEKPPAILSTWIPANQDAWDQTNAGDNCPFTNNSHGFVCVTKPASTTTTSNVPSNGTYSGYICPSIDSGKKNSALASLIYNGCYTSVSTTQQVSSGSGASCGSHSNCSCSGNNNKKKCTRTYYQHDWVVNAHSTWNGCVVDRGNSAAPSSGNYDTNVTLPNTSYPDRQYAAEQYDSCPQAVMGLSSNWTGMNTLVTNMNPDGNTNQGVGLQIGWMSLIGGPFTVPAKDASYQYSEVIILLTDGLNTQNRWYTDATSIDSRQATTCANAKAAGKTIYTVQVNTGGDPTQAVLKNCASTPDKFFLLTNANQMLTTFNTIGTALSNLRISQ